MDGATGRIRRELEELADPAYRDFHAKPVPTVDPARILGVRTPALRSLAKRLARERPLDAWTHNKALQKARESRRATPGQKAHLQSLKV